MRSALWPEADAAELAREAAAFFTRPYLIDAVFVAEAPDGDLVGFVELSLRSHADGCSSSPVPYVEGWYVVPAARRQGVGRALFAAAEAWGTAGGPPRSRQTCRSIIASAPRHTQRLDLTKSSAPSISAKRSSVAEKEARARTPGLRPKS